MTMGLASYVYSSPASSRRLEYRNLSLFFHEWAGSYHHALYVKVSKSCEFLCGVEKVVEGVEKVCEFLFM